MSLETTVICLDNSEYSRNGDFPPSRLSAEMEAVGDLIRHKLRSHPQNEVALVSLGGRPEVLSSPTSDQGLLHTRVWKLALAGPLQLVSGLKVAQLVLKHRREKAHRQRVVAFVGSPLMGQDGQELVAQAKKMRKEKVNVDLVCFGDGIQHLHQLALFVDTINGKEKEGGSHLVVVGSGPRLSLAGSALLGGGMGGTEDILQDDDVDPELRMALQLSMQEYGKSQGGQQAPADPQIRPTQALPTAASYAALTEEEQIQLALALSLREPASTDQASDDLDLEFSELPSQPIYFPDQQDERDHAEEEEEANAKKKKTKEK